ncbi:MAG: N-acetyltransferase [Deltaproteobacteria bacterium]|nr:N-acetyltransferase [Deltaproteobacteria bacterium]
MAEPLVRPALRSDLAEITAIYNHYVEAGPVTFDVRIFSESDREAWFEQFAMHGAHRLLVVEEDGAVQGYAGSMPFRSKPAYATSVEATIYVASECQGRGHATRLYEALFSALADQDLNRILAGITLPNDPSIRLHERFGFRKIGVFTEVGRKHDQYWDVAWYERSSATWERPLRSV